MRARIRESYNEIIQKTYNLLNVFGMMFSEGKTSLTLKEIITEINNLIKECSNLISDFSSINKDIYDNDLKMLNHSTYHIRTTLEARLKNLSEHEEHKKNPDPSKIIIIKANKTNADHPKKISFDEWYDEQSRWNKDRGRVLHRDHISAPIKGLR